MIPQDDQNDRTITSPPVHPERKISVKAVFLVLGLIAAFLFFFGPAIFGT